MSELLAPAEVEWRRLDRRMLLVHPVVEVGKAAPAILGALIAGHSLGSGFGLGIAVAVVVAAVSVLRWCTTRYRITVEGVQLRRGLVHRRELVTPLDRVRTVDVTSHLLHRVFGLARVVIGTGKSDRNGHDKLVLDGLTAAAASALRAELLHRRHVDAPIELVKRASAEEELARIDPRWLRFAPFTLTGAVTGLALLGVFWRVINEAHVNLRTFGPVRYVARHFEHWPLWLSIGAAVAFVVGFVVVASTAGYVLAFWRFRLTRHAGGTIHVTRGLITTRATSIERRRLRGAEVSEPLLLRAVAGARCLAIATGLRVGRGAERGGEILLPPAPHAIALDVAATVLGTRSPFTESLLPHPIAARRRRVLRAVAGAAALVVLGAVVVEFAGWPLAWLLLGLVPLAAGTLLGLDRYRSLGHGFVDGFVVTRFGSLVRRRSALHADGVIGWNLRRSFFQRRSGLASLTATTAAGRQGYTIADVAEDEAVAYADRAVPQLLAAFLIRP